MSVFRKLAVSATLAVASLATLPSAAFAAPADDEAAFVADINALRATKGLAPLAVDPQLTDMARAFCMQMAAGNHIFHNPDLAKQAPSSWLKLGENVGVGGTEPSLHQAFVNSPDHYRNLVDAEFGSVGVGVVYANDRKWVVEDFMKSSAPTPTPTPTKPVVATPGTSTTPGSPSSSSPALRAARYRLALQHGGRLGARSSTQKLILDKYLAKG